MLSLLLDINSLRLWSNVLMEDFFELSSRKPLYSIDFIRYSFSLSPELQNDLLPLSNVDFIFKKYLTQSFGLTIDYENGWLKNILRIYV